MPEHTTLPQQTRNTELPPRRVILLGTGTIIPHKERGQSSFVLESLDEFFLFDCGSGTETSLARAGIDPNGIDHIFITHHHIDHDSGVMPLLKGMWLSGKKDVTLYGPEGTAEWYEALLDVWPYMRDRMNVGVVEMVPGDDIPVSHLVVSCERMVHGIPCLGYRVRFPEGTSLVYSGDTEPCDGLQRLLNGHTSVLIHECALPETLTVTNHTTPQALADFFSAAKNERKVSIDTIILTHFYRENMGRDQEIVEIIKKKVPGAEVICAWDLMELVF